MRAHDLPPCELLSSNDFGSLHRHQQGHLFTVPAQNPVFSIGPGVSPDYSFQFSDGIGNSPVSSVPEPRSSRSPDDRSGDPRASNAPVVAGVVARLLAAPE